MHWTSVRFYSFEVLDQSVMLSDAVALYTPCFGDRQKQERERQVDFSS